MKYHVFEVSAEDTKDLFAGRPVRFNNALYICKNWRLKGDDSDRFLVTVSAIPDLDGIEIVDHVAPIPVPESDPVTETIDESPKTEPVEATDVKEPVDESEASAETENVDDKS